MFSQFFKFRRLSSQESLLWSLRLTDHFLSDNKFPNVDHRYASNYAPSLENPTMSVPASAAWGNVALADEGFKMP